MLLLAVPSVFALQSVFWILPDCMVSIITPLLCLQCLPYSQFFVYYQIVWSLLLPPCCHVAPCCAFNVCHTPSFLDIARLYGLYDYPLAVMLLLAVPSVFAIVPVFLILPDCMVSIITPLLSCCSLLCLQCLPYSQFFGYCQIVWSL